MLKQKQNERRAGTGTLCAHLITS